MNYCYLAKSIEKAIIELLESWMKSLQNDICEFLRVLNVRKRSNLCQKALDTLYKYVNHDYLFYYRCLIL